MNAAEAIDACAAHAETIGKVALSMSPTPMAAALALAVAAEFLDYKLQRELGAVEYEEFRVVRAAILEAAKGATVRQLANHAAVAQ